MICLAHVARMREEFLWEAPTKETILRFVTCIGGCGLDLNQNVDK